MEETYAVEAKELSFSYASESPTLRGLSLRARQGEFACILGRSGCGKSTLLSLIMGLMAPDSGVIRINGAPMRGPDTDRAIVFQDYSLFPWMTARQNVAFGIEHSRTHRPTPASAGEKKFLLGQTGGRVARKEASALADDFLAQVGLYESRDKYPHQLSGGMRQRAAIARALAMDSDIWLFDEPFSALDPQMRGSLQTLVMELAKRGRPRTVLFVTHNVDEAVTLGEKIFFLAGGRIRREIAVPFAYPRVKDEVARAPEYFAIASELAQLFYETRGKERGAE